MKKFKRITTGEAGEFWAFVDATAAEVDQWPAWKKVLFPEKSLPVVPVKREPSRKHRASKGKRRIAGTDK